jgi:excisionase family DNA binding protein
MLNTTYLTVAEVAQVLRVDPEAVGEMCRTGRLPATKPAGRWLITTEDFAAFLAAGSNQPSDAA